MSHRYMKRFMKNFIISVKIWIPILFRSIKIWIGNVFRTIKTYPEFRRMMKEYKSYFDPDDWSDEE